MLKEKRSCAWLLAQKLRRSMIDPKREPLEGVAGTAFASLEAAEHFALAQPKGNDQ